MKKWCKIFKLKKYDVLLIRMVTDEDGEHVVLILRINNGQFIKTVSFDDDTEKAEEFYDKYQKKHAEEFVEEFEKEIIKTKDDE